MFGSLKRNPYYPLPITYCVFLANVEAKISILSKCVKLCQKCVKIVYGTKGHFFLPILLFFKKFFYINWQKVVKKCPINPQTRINTGFFTGRFCFQKCPIGTEKCPINPIFCIFDQKYPSNFCKRDKKVSHKQKVSHKVSRKNCVKNVSKL